MYHRFMVIIGEEEFIKEGGKAGVPGNLATKK